jgi:hypothetical protein
MYLLTFFLLFMLRNVVSYYWQHRIVEPYNKASAFTERLSAFERLSPFAGLLSTCIYSNNISEFRENFFTKKLNLTACEEKYSSPNVLWNSFLEDVGPGEDAKSLLGDISRKAETFVNSNVVYDREEIISALTRVRKGDLLSLTGDRCSC